MKNMNFMYLMDMIDDKYIVEAKMLPKTKVVDVDSSRFISFFSGVMSVAAAVIVFGAIIIWTLVGKDILSNEQGDDTSKVTTAPIVTTEPDVYSEGLDIKLTYDNKGCVVSGIGTCTDTEIVIPLEYMGLPIVKIENNAFYKCTNITSVIIPSKEGFTEILSSNKTMIMFLREDMHSVPGYENTTLDVYVELIRNVNKNFSPTEIKKEDGLVYIEYEFHNEEENQTYKYLTVMYEQGGGIFWTVQFATTKAGFDSLRPDLIEWAKSVKFA